MLNTSVVAEAASFGVVEWDHGKLAASGAQNLRVRTDTHKYVWQIGLSLTNTLYAVEAAQTRVEARAAVVPVAAQVDALAAAVDQRIRALAANPRVAGG
jgi:hypothetical protein